MLDFHVPPPGPPPFYWSDERLGFEPLEAIAADVIARVEAPPPDLKAMSVDEIDELIAATPILEGDEFCRQVTVQNCALYWRSIKGDPDPKLAADFARYAQEMADESDSELGRRLAAECAKAAQRVGAPRVVSPASFTGKPVPARRWFVRDWLPCGVVTGLYGDGGLGKSLLAQQLQTGTALGSTWIGLPVEQIVSLGLYCEDDEDELQRRQASIDGSYGVDLARLGDAHWMPRLGEDNLLMTFASNGSGELTKFHAHVLTAALDLKARLVIVDAAADTFGGNENDRNHVRQYVQRALGSIALKIKGAVLCNAHPSREGLKSGTGDSGSTGWSNAFRSRLFLNEPKLEAGEPPDPDVRVLERKKANYASRGNQIRLRWRQGVIEPERPEAPGATPFGKLDAKAVFVSLHTDFEGMGRPLSANNHAGNFAPRLFAKLPRETQPWLCSFA
jgi:hypothetical protein